MIQLIRPLALLAALSVVASAAAEEYILRFDAVTVEYGTAPNLAFDPALMKVWRCETEVRPGEKFSLETVEEGIPFQVKGRIRQSEGGLWTVEIEQSHGAPPEPHTLRQTTCSLLPGEVQFLGGGYGRSDGRHSLQESHVSLFPLPRDDAARQRQLAAIRSFEVARAEARLTSILASEAAAMVRAVETERIAAALLAQAQATATHDRRAARELLRLLRCDCRDAPQVAVANELDKTWFVDPPPARSDRLPSAGLSPTGDYVLRFDVLRTIYRDPQTAFAPERTVVWRCETPVRVNRDFVLRIADGETVMEVRGRILHWENGRLLFHAERKLTAPTFGLGSHGGTEEFAIGQIFCGGGGGSRGSLGLARDEESQTRGYTSLLPMPANEAERQRQIAEIEAFEMAAERARMEESARCDAENERTAAVLLKLARQARETDPPLAERLLRFLDESYGSTAAGQEARAEALRPANEDRPG